MKKRFSISTILSILGLIFSLLTFLFGRNVIGQFKKAELMYTTKKIELKFPGKIVIQNTKKSVKFIPDTYREVTVINKGAKSSVNLKLSITVDGEIFDVEILSIEDYKITNRKDSKIEISMTRLAKNAEIKFKFWLKQNQKSFLIMSIDDQGSASVKSMETLKDTFNLRVPSLLLGIIFLLIIFYQLITKPKNNTIRQLKVTNQKLKERNEILTNELNECQDEIIENIDEPETDIITKLKEIIKKELN